MCGKISCVNPQPVAPATPTKTDALLNLNPFWWLLFIFALNVATPFLPIGNLGVAIASNIVLTLVYVGAVVLFALGIARREWNLMWTLLGFGLSVATWLLVQNGLLPMVASSLGRGVKPSATQILGLTGAVTAQDMALLCAATFGGVSLARRIPSANMLGPIGGIIAVIDIWGVLFGGPVSQILNSRAAQPISEKAMTSGPQIGAIGAAKPEFAIPLPQIGVGDFLFLALLLGIIVIHRMNWRTPAWATWLLVSGALLSITFLPFFPALPGLLFIGAGAVLPNLKYFTYTRDEKFALLWAGVLVLVMTVGIHFGLQRMLANLDDKPIPRAAIR